MNTFARCEALREMDQIKERCGNPRADTVLQEVCSNEQISSQIPVRTNGRDERAYETYIGGAGI